MILSKDKYEVKSAHNGDEALKILEEFDPDLILLDLVMPVMSGIDFLKEYSKHDVIKPKVLIITNLDSGNAITEAISLGGYKCIVKSHTTPQGLKKIVKTTLKSRA
jgi:DNA-binding response OmpR family regulator